MLTFPDTGGGTLPKCFQAALVAIRPLGERAINPARTKNGSATLSMVSVSSPTAIANVDSPTGPPLNRSTSAVITALSSRSSPI